MQEEFDVGVVGGGIVGLLTAWQLAKYGQRTILFERNQVNNSQGSSKGNSRMFGESFEREIYFKLACRSRELWHDLENESGEKLLYLNGGLDIVSGSNSKEGVKKIASALRRRKKEFDLLDAVSLHQRYSQFNVNQKVNAVYSPDSGILRADKCMSTAVLAAKKLGVVIKDEAKVVALKLENRMISITLASDRKYYSREVVLAAGPWMPVILGKLGVNLPLTVSQEQTVYFVPQCNLSSFEPENFPVWEWDGAQFVYGFPIFEERGIKIAFHQDGHKLKSLREFKKTPSREVIDRLGLFLNKHIPDAAGEAFGATTCLYTNTPDNDFVSDAVSDIPQIKFFTGDSGHGFHCAPAIAEILADLSFKGKTTLDISPFSLRRFTA